MIRVVVFFVIVGLVALGAAWFADRPGDVTINWLGYHIETSVGVLIAAIAAVVLITLLVWSTVRAIFRAPDVVSVLMRNRRTARAHAAITHGLIAIGAGDPGAARRYAHEAKRFAPADPLALLLGAQTAQLAGDRATAEETFRAMAARDDTKLLGLHGLFVEAQRRQDPVSARLFAEEAARTAPALAWAGQAVLEFRCADGDWTGALEALESNLHSGLVAKETYRRQRAVLLTAQALALEETDRAAAQPLAYEAVRLAPDLVPAAALAGRFLGEAGELRRASRILEAAWRANPHPDLATTYTYLRVGDSARDRLSRVEILVRLMPGHPEGALAFARAAIDAREFALARNALAPLLAAPTKRVAMRMAEIEELEHGDTGRAREWMARAVHAAPDPAWTADGLVSDRWMPVSPVSGRLDAFQWRVPLAELPAPASYIEPDAGPDSASTTALAPVSVGGSEPDRSGIAAPEQPEAAKEAAPIIEVQAQSPILQPPAPQPSAAPRAEPPRAAAPAPRKVETVMPLVHAPDDPGPESEPDREFVPEHPKDRSSSNWQRLRSWFT
ncbi:MAG TPA: heme biosynthesis HemY N-terminal domain-containing protein [Xanthobacteraceae bacterium]|nr:heme biosynthesis HemY N-terminal domain-containing protein [Xanthobacteraceae bacterium]